MNTPSEKNYTLPKIAVAALVSSSLSITSVRAEMSSEILRVSQSTREKLKQDRGEKVIENRDKIMKIILDRFQVGYTMQQGKIATIFYQGEQYSTFALKLKASDTDPNFYSLFLSLPINGKKRTVELAMDVTMWLREKE